MLMPVSVALVNAKSCGYYMHGNADMRYSCKFVLCKMSIDHSIAYPFLAQHSIYEHSIEFASDAG